MDRYFRISIQFVNGRPISTMGSQGFGNVIHKSLKKLQIVSILPTSLFHKPGWFCKMVQCHHGFYSSFAEFLTPGLIPFHSRGITSSARFTVSRTPSVTTRRDIRASTLVERALDVITQTPSKPRATIGPVCCGDGLTPARRRITRVKIPRQSDRR